MSIPDRLFHLLDVLDIDQKKFAEEIGLTDKVVSKWKSGGLKSYTKYLQEIVGYFGTPPDYFLERGVFKNWEEIMTYPISVCQELRIQLPNNFRDPMIGKDDEQIAWLDKRMCYGITGKGEVDLIHWFYRNVREVIIKKDNDIPERYDPATVTIRLAERIVPKRSILIDELAEEERILLEAYRAADDRTRQMVDLALEPWKKSSAHDVAM